MEKRSARLALNGASYSMAQVNQKMTVNRKLAAVALLRLENVTRDTVRTIVPLLENGEVTGAEDLETLLEEIATCAGRHTHEQFEKAWKAAKRIEERCGSLGIEIISRWDKEYPVRLRSIQDSPAILYVKGDADSLNSSMSVAIIGTREPTDFGKGSAVKISSYFAEAGVCVVSGLARGCDTLAHKGCLKEGGLTVAVLAHGLDQIYPPENGELATKIFESGGCLVSEYPPGTKPSGLAFVERDRIQSGLSDATIVIETGVKGGTLHTANYCLQQGRMLAALTHPEKYKAAEKAQGNKMLINKRGAVAITDRIDLEQKILQFLLDCRSGKRSLSDWKRYNCDEQLTLQVQ